MAKGTLKISGADALLASDLAPDSVDSSELVDGSIDTSHIGNLQVTAAKVASDVATTAGTQTLTNKTLTAPTLTTPALGTPASGVVTNLSGVLPVGVTGGSGLTALGTVTSGNLSSEDIVMPRIKEFGKFYYGTVTTTSVVNQDAINISGSNTVALTPEHTGDLFEFSWRFCVNATGYNGHGIQRATNSAFSTGVATQWSTGRHAWGNMSSAVTTTLDYVDSAGSITVDATGLSAGTTYYFRLIGMTHSTSATHQFGVNTTNSTNGTGTRFSAKRWSIV